MHHIANFYVFIFSDMRDVSNLKNVLFLLIPYCLMEFFYGTASVLSFFFPTDDIFYGTWWGFLILTFTTIIFFFLNFLIVFYGLLYFNRLLHRLYDKILSKIK